MKLVRFLMNVPHTTSQPVTVELKNGSSVNGQILSCTPLMNISMKNIKLVEPHMDPQLLQFMNIRGNQVRQILLPDDLNLDTVLDRSVKKMKGQGAGPGTKRADGGPGKIRKGKGTGRGGSRFNKARGF